MEDYVSLPPDNEARELALDIAQSHHVEAPAGSGKTMLLVARFIKLLCHVRHPHEILALTFTNKAAGEMKARIAGLLQKACSGLEPVSEPEAALMESAKEALKQHEAHHFLLLSPEGIQVMTFHGFCYTLVKRAPLEAEVPTESVLLGEEEQELVLDESIKEMIGDVVSMPEGAPERRAFEGRLLRLNNRLPVLVDEIRDLVKKRDLFSDLVKALAVYHNLDDFEADLTRRMGGVISDFLGEASQAFKATSIGQRWSPFWHHLKEKGAPNADLLPEDLPGTAWTDLPAWKAMAEALTTRSGKPRQQMGPVMGGFYKGFAKGLWGQQVRGLPQEPTRLLCDLKDLPEPNVSLTDIDALADLIILVAQVITTYERRCRQQHVLDFVGLEQAALKTVGKDAVSDLQLFLDHRIQHILVDEFQDTSRSQWAFIQGLCAGWVHGDGRTIFLVGDPKQSVYAFRKAEVRLFLEARKGIPVAGQGLLPVTNTQLEANFRSQAPLVTWTNQLFSHTAMANPKAAFDEVPFQPSKAHPQLQANPNIGPVSLNIFFKDASVSSPAEAEAQWLAQTVNYLVDERSPGATIGILLFTRNRLPLYLKALRKIGLTVRVKEGLKVAEQPEVMHLYQMATAMCRPHDDLAWASLVRSPWSWIDATLLLNIARMAPVAWSRKLKLASEQYPEIERIQYALDRGRRRVGRDSLAEVVRDVWMALDGPARVAARFGTEGVANCRLFIEVLESIETGIPEETLLRLDLALETLYAPESPDAAGASVDLMTVHAAKGLEFDIVFLPFLDWRPLAVGQHPPYLLERSPEPPGLPVIAMGPDRRLGEPEPSYRLLKRLADGRKVGEARRLLYVGITRARKELFLSGLATNTTGVQGVRNTAERTHPANSSKDNSTATKGIGCRRKAVFLAPDAKLSANKQCRLKAPKASPLAWILRHTTDHDAELISTFLNPAGPTVAHEKVKRFQPLPDPVPFEGQPLPYLIVTPSELADTSLYAQVDAPTLPSPLKEKSLEGGEGETEPVEHAAIKGTISHRLIEALWHDGQVPETKRIATALAAEGMNPDEATAIAQEITDEVRACQKEPFFQWLLDRTRPNGESEYAIEAVNQPGKIQTGILDFVKQDGDRWWIVDFKTSRPVAGQTEAEFVKQHVEFYRPQLTAYQAMLAKVKGVDIAQIRVGLYFTSLQQWHEITQGAP
jgi:ATP-dependent helicase/nuclease subunit A